MEMAIHNPVSLVSSDYCHAGCDSRTLTTLQQADLGSLIRTSLDNFGSGDIFCHTASSPISQLSPYSDSTYTDSPSSTELDLIYSTLYEHRDNCEDDDDDDMTVILDDEYLACLEKSGAFKDRDNLSLSLAPDNVAHNNLHTLIKQEPRSSPLPSFAELCGRARCSHSISEDSDYHSLQSAGSDEEDSDDKPYCKSRRGAKHVLLWKFLLQALEQRPDLIRWVNQRDGTFKFVDTSALSRMWGEKKRKGDMNFEKLSRGIRHYYKSGLMTRKEGTRLVYQFHWSRLPKTYRKY